MLLFSCNVMIKLYTIPQGNSDGISYKSNRTLYEQGRWKTKVLHGSEYNEQFTQGLVIYTLVSKYRLKWVNRVR